MGEILLASGTVKFSMRAIFREEMPPWLTSEWLRAITLREEKNLSRERAPESTETSDVRSQMEENIG